MPNRPICRRYRTRLCLQNGENMSKLLATCKACKLITKQSTNADSPFALQNRTTWNCKQLEIVNCRLCTGKLITQQNEVHTLIEIMRRSLIKTLNKKEITKTSTIWVLWNAKFVSIGTQFWYLQICGFQCKPFLSFNWRLWIYNVNPYNVEPLARTSSSNRMIGLSLSLSTETKMILVNDGKFIS